MFLLHHTIFSGIWQYLWERIEEGIGTNVRGEGETRAKGAEKNKKREKGAKLQLRGLYILWSMEQKGKMLAYWPTR